jgi:hypothetical protein
VAPLVDILTKQKSRNPAPHRRVSTRVIVSWGRSIVTVYTRRARVGDVTVGCQRSKAHSSVLVLCGCSVVAVPCQRRWMRLVAPCPSGALGLSLGFSRVLLRAHGVYTTLPTSARHCNHTQQWCCIQFASIWPLLCLPTSHNPGLALPPASRLHSHTRTVTAERLTADTSVAARETLASEVVRVLDAAVFTHGVTKVRTYVRTHLTVQRAGPMLCSPHACSNDMHGC